MITTLYTRPNETPIILEEDNELPRIANDEQQGFKKKPKKGKKMRSHEENK